MAYLRERGLDAVIRSLTQPVLGICIGQQLLCRHSEEGDVDCLGIFDADVKRFQPTRHEDKVPCMGWGPIDVRVKMEDGRGMMEDGGCKLFEGLQPKADSAEPSLPYVYFVHSYYVPLCRETIAVADHILPYSAALHKDNFFACQFHPEKSGRVGEQILRNFMEL